MVSVVSSLATALLLLVLFGAAGTTLALTASASAPQGPPPTVAPLVVAAGSPDAAIPRYEPAPAGSKNLSPPQAVTSYLSASGAAFRPLWSSTEHDYDGGGCQHVIYGTFYHLSFPVLLPHGSVITELRLDYKDTNPSFDASLALARFDGGQQTTFIVTPTTTGSGGWGSATVNLDEQLDYANYSYQALWTQPFPGDTLQLCGLRVTYTPPGIFGVALPMVTKNN